MDALEFRVLGPLEIRTAGGQALSLGRRKERLLLAALLLGGEHVRTTDQLVSLLWADRPPPSATANLYSYLSNLRRILPPGRLDGHRLTVRPGDLDADHFATLVTAGITAAEEQRYAVAAERLATALGLWRTGTVVEGLALPGVLHPEVTRLERLRDRAVEASYRSRLALGQHDSLVPELQDLLERQPLDEPLRTLLMEAQYRSGRRADALDTYQRARKVLRDELGVDPGTALRDLHARIVRSDPTLDGPVRVSVSIPAPAQLPTDLASFTGRRDEVDRLIGLLSDDRPDAVVITAVDGMAGIGKTALATHVAHRLRGRYSDGQLFVDLHGHTEGLPPVDPADALDRMLRALGIRDADVPSDTESRTALFRTMAAGRKMLVVLDNAASESQIRPLLPGAAGCAVLVTSRSILGGLDDVRRLALDVLDYADASTLFAQVAGQGRIATSPRPLIDEVLGLCGMLPLALRLAAGRLRSRPVWTVADLVARLRDEDSRLTELSAGERSIAASLDLSYRYLPVGEQRMFRLLGQLPGGDIEPYAVAAITGVPVADAERLLENLLDVHLIMQHTTGRYVLHDLLRVYAARLGRRTDSDNDRRAAVGRLLAHYVVVAAAAADLVYPADRADRPDIEPIADADGPSRTTIWPDEDGARRWLDAELANMLAAAEYAADHGWPERTVQLARILTAHLRARYNDRAAIPLYSLGRRCADDLADAPAEFVILRALGDLHRRRSEYQQANECFRAAIALADRLDDRSAVCDVLFGLGFLERLEGRVASATKYHEEALELARETGHAGMEARILNGLGMDLLAVGDLKKAESYHDEALAIATEIDDRWQQYVSLNHLGRVHKITGRAESSLTYYRRGLDLATELGDQRGAMVATVGIADLQLAAGRHADAMESYRTALQITQELDDSINEGEILKRIGQVHSARGEHGIAVDHQRRSLTIADRLDNPNLRFEAMLSLCESLRGQRQMDESLSYGESSVRLAEQLGQRHDEGRALTAVGDTHAARGDDDLAREHWRRALDVFTDLGAVERSQVAERLQPGDLE